MDNQMNNMGNQMNNMGSQVNGQMPADAPWFTLWMIISIVQMLACNTLSGAICLVLIVLGDSDYKQGEYAKAENKKKIAMIVSLVGVVLTVILAVVLFLYFGFIVTWIATNFQ